jgi:hypothetical protein
MANADLHVRLVLETRLQHDEDGLLDEAVRAGAEAVAEVLAAGDTLGRSASVEFRLGLNTRTVSVDTPLDHRVIVFAGELTESVPADTLF